MHPKAEKLQDALKYWQTLYSDSDAHFDKTISIDVKKIKPQVTWGTSPEMVVAIDECIPSFESQTSSSKKPKYERCSGIYGFKTWHFDEGDNA